MHVYMSNACAYICMTCLYRCQVPSARARRLRIELSKDALSLKPVLFSQFTEEQDVVGFWHSVSSSC